MDEDPCNINGVGRLSRISRFHAALQLIVARRLSEMGFKSAVEYKIDDVHVADVYAYRDGESIIVEVETGYLPPMFISRAEDYIEAKVAVKAIKYSCAADKFYIAMPSYLRLPMPQALMSSSVNLSELKLLGAKVREFFGDRWEAALLERGDRCRITGAMYVNIAKRSVNVVDFGE
jgi:hypothetical protein